MKKLVLCLFLTVALSSFSSNKNKFLLIAENPLLKISICNTNNSLWDYSLPKTGKSFTFKAPEFEIDGNLISANISSP
ncbi:MAG TPA: hypothetical protein VIK55_04650, partial [Paludibacter sp.]